MVQLQISFLSSESCISFILATNTASRDITCSSTKCAKTDRIYAQGKVCITLSSSSSHTPNEYVPSSFPALHRPAINREVLLQIRGNYSDI